MKTIKQFIFGRIRSFGDAFVGIWTLLRSQRNAWLHLCATGAVVALGVWFGVTRLEWCLLILAMIAVWASEGLNTSVECLADKVSPEFDPQIKHSKDVAAGAVLLSAIGSAIIGILVFFPYVVDVVGS